MANELIGLILLITMVQGRRIERYKTKDRAGFNWWEAWGPVYLGGTGRLQQLYD